MSIGEMVVLYICAIAAILFIFSLVEKRSMLRETRERKEQEESMRRSRAFIAAAIEEHPEVLSDHVAAKQKQTMDDFQQRLADPPYLGVPRTMLFEIAQRHQEMQRQAQEQKRRELAERLRRDQGVIDIEAKVVDFDIDLEKQN
jgi:hypothetical protein